MSESTQHGIINDNPLLQKLYSSLESRLGYRLFLGGTRHFGYYDSPSSWPLNVDQALRAIEARLLEALRLPKGAQVLDAGCGVGLVALYIAQQGGLQVQGIDVMEHHVLKAKRNIVSAGMTDMITARRMDYHHLESLGGGSLDGVYTMETLVHSTDPLHVLRGFARILRPGGRIVLHEWEHMSRREVPADEEKIAVMINHYSAMPAFTLFEQGVLETMVKEAGFVDLEVKDFSRNIVPMLWLFYVVAFLPYMFIRLLGLERWFINTVTGYKSYRLRHGWSYVQISASKASGRVSHIAAETQNSVRQR